MSEQRIAKSVPAIDWLRAHIDHDGAECLPWPFAVVDGYGVMWTKEKYHYAHKLMCELVHGPAPSPQHLAARSCGRNGIPCVHPLHLSWKSRSQIRLEEAAAWRAAPRPKRAWKLSRAQTLKVRALKGKKTQRAIAKQFGISQQTVSWIQSERHGFIKGRRQEVLFAALAAASGPMTLAEITIAAKFPNGRTAHQQMCKFVRRGDIERVKASYRLPFTPERSRQAFDAVGAAISRGLPPQMRDDVHQDVALQIIEGEVALGDIRAAVAAAIKRYHKLHPSTYGPTSLDAAISGTEGLTLHDLIIGSDGRSEMMAGA